MDNITELRSLIREVAESEVQKDRPTYVIVMLNRDTWDQLQKLEPLHYGPALKYPDESACHSTQSATTLLP